MKEQMENLFDTDRSCPDREVVTVLHEDEYTRIEKILSAGQQSPDGFWYDQEETEWVSVLQGNAVLEFEDRKVFLSKGDQYLIPAHCRHRVMETSSDPVCIWLCVFTKPHTQEIERKGETDGTEKD